MLKSEKRTALKNTVIRIIGTMFVITVIILRCIGGPFQDFCDAALPWVTIGVAVAVILCYSRKDKE